MKIIFSRKGFDSGYGGVPSPILPDRQLLSLPIPLDDELRTFGNVYFDSQPLAKIVQPLTKNTIKAAYSCHLDPDLRIESVKRHKDWRPSFGQVDAAQSHLKNQGVGVGDLFLFFGWFRETEYREGQLAYKRGAPDIHVIYGWLQVGEIYQPTKDSLHLYPWLNEHPHCIGDYWGSNNSVYLASPILQIDGIDKEISGGGVFPKYKRELQLTRTGATRSVWKLPGWMHPEGRNSTLSYHGDSKLWVKDGVHTILRSRAKGQEFVLDTDHYPESLDWIATLVRNSM